VDPISRHDADPPDSPDRAEPSDHSDHLTPEQLDELAAEASADSDPDQPGPDPAGEPLQAHLATCAACRAALGDQVAVAAWLRNAPSSGPMPLDVITRLDTALAGAAAGRQAASMGGAGGPGNVLPIDGHQRGGRLAALAESRLTKSLVAAVLVGLIAVGGYSALHHHSSPGQRTASSAGAASSAAQPAGKSVSDVTIQHSGRAYTKADIAAQVTAELAHRNDSATGAVAPSESGGATTLTTPAGLLACLLALNEPTSTPLLVDIATYAGQPAAVLVLQQPGGAREIWVVSPTCAPGGSKDGTRYFATLG
jgi:hypothetical protein